MNTIRLGVGGLLVLLSLKAIAQYSGTVLQSPGYRSSAATATTGAVHAGSVSGPGLKRAVIWSGAALTVVHPSAYTRSWINSVDGTQMAGTVEGASTGNRMHAALWLDRSDSIVDLHPTGFAESYATGSGGGVQVGYGSQNNRRIPLMWRGSADSVVDLLPSEAQYGQAMAASLESQVGEVNIGDHARAFLWQGTRESAVNLHPATYSESAAYGVSEQFQVGTGIVGSEAHALMWQGSADSVIDLHPAGTTFSTALATAGDVQVGYAQTAPSGLLRAFSWSGSSASAVNLHQFLPSGYQQSQATAVAENGTIVGVAFDASGGTVAVEWQPVPEPSGLDAVFVAGSLIAICLLKRRRQRDSRRLL